MLEKNLENCLNNAFKKAHSSNHEFVTRASFGLIDKFIELFNLPFTPSIRIIQLVAILLIIFQEMVYVLTIHILAYSLFPRLNSNIPEPPKIINGLVDFGDLNKLVGELTGIETNNNSSFTVEAFNEYNSTISEKIIKKKN